MLEEVAVADSSIWISALQFGGTPRLALELASKRQLVCCAYIRAEVQSKLAAKFGWNPSKIRREMGQYLGDVTDVTLPGILRGICRDPKDDAILECAVIAKARFLISGDHDLLALETYAACEIVTARQYVDRLGSST